VRRVIALELDGALVDELRARMPGNVEVHLADARAVDVEGLLGVCAPYKMAGNLPYYAALPILRGFLEASCRPTRAAVLVQREVAERMCASPGDMSLVSLGVQLFGAPRVARIVRPGSFVPPPKVTSAVVAIDVFPEPAEGVTNVDGFFRVARAGFSAPRKQLRNSLASGLSEPADVAERLLVRAGIDPSRRPASLSIAEWASLARARG
jgi:16S rRNA (adenine1518-N6/adenine1519-N6)-dimethyltransferase